MPVSKRSDIANILYGGQRDYKKLFQSEPLAALTLPVTLQAGYGVLEAGMGIAENKSASGGDGKFLPYNPATFTGAEDHPGRAYLVANSGTAVNVVYVTLADSYKFGVGDDIIINDDTTTAENLGAITEIDRTTYPHMAKITFTTVVGGTSFTTARFAYVSVEAGASNNYSVCVAILQVTVDTGEGANAKGAVAPLIVSNAVLYTGMLVNVDSTARTAIGASTFGQYTIIK